MQEKYLEEYSKIENKQLTYYDRGGHHVFKGINDLCSSNPDLVSEWDFKNNTDNKIRRPWQYTANSHKKVYWICKSCRNSWQASIDSRNRGNGCPKCARQASMPELVLSEFFKAINIHFEEQTPIESYRVDFVIENHIALEYNGIAFHKELISDRKSKSIREYGIDTIIIINECIGTYVDIEKINNIIVINHDIKSKNSSLNNFDILLSNLSKVLDDLGVKVTKITDNVDIKELEKKAILNKGIAHNSINELGDYIMQEYCYESNPDPLTVSKGSNSIKIKWKCRDCGYIYEATPLNKKRGDMCPVCSGRRFESGYNDLLTKCPEIATEIKNDNPRLIRYNSAEKVTWLCRNCGCEWESRVVDRTVLDMACRNCGYVKMYRDTHREYKFKDISTKYEVQYFKYRDRVINEVYDEKELLIHIINSIQSEYLDILLCNEYLITDDSGQPVINYKFLASRYKAKQKIYKLFELLGYNVNDILVKPVEII
jgi:very-short-patch-repair endonuclease/DNA-directed RNA polymerase subunit RPC12/RpoP